MCLSFINFFPEKLSKFLTNLTVERNTSTFSNNEDEITVFTIGTGSPLNDSRVQSGTAIFVKDKFFIFDVGDGVVTKAQYDSGWGRYIKIDHGYGYETVYAHLYKIKVKKGQKVNRGDIIGKSGNSGRAAGFHLHYEVHKNKKTVDPLKHFFTGNIK